MFWLLTVALPFGSDRVIKQNSTHLIHQTAELNSFFTFIFLKHILVRLEVLQFVGEHIRSRSVTGHCRGGRGWSFTSRTSELKPCPSAWPMSAAASWPATPCFPPTSTNRPMSGTSSADSAVNLSRSAGKRTGCGYQGLSFTVSSSFPAKASRLLATLTAFFIIWRFACSFYKCYSSWPYCACVSLVSSQCYI